LLKNPQRLQQEYQRRLDKPDRENEDLTTTQAQLNKIRQGIARLIDSYAEGFIEKQEFEPRIKRLRQRLAELEDRDRQLRAQLTQQTELQLVITQLEDFASKLKDGLAEADWLTKRELIRTLVQRVEIGPEKVNIVFRVIPDPFESSPDRGSLQHCWRRGWPFL
jgi:site-specific DNA recombinase